MILNPTHCLEILNNFTLDLSFLSTICWNDETCALRGPAARAWPRLPKMGPAPWQSPPHPLLLIRRGGFKLKLHPPHSHLSEHSGTLGSHRLV